MIDNRQIQVPSPEVGIVPVPLTDETMTNRLNRVREAMQAADYDALVVYADLEHGSNFEYLVGFVPRFEEALLVLHQDGTAYLVLGNENLNKADKARLPAQAVHLPYLSLPNQPMATTHTVEATLATTGIGKTQKLGVVGWKLFTSKTEANADLFDLPHYLVQALQHAAPDARLINATDLFIGADGVRTTNNANEVAHYEYGAALAGNAMLKAMADLAVGKTELEVAAALDAAGQPHSVITIMAAGERFIKANLYPTAHKIALGEPVTMTTGFKGGLQTRAGFAVHDAAELPAAQSDYLERVAKPYYAAFASWLETARIGLTGAALYQQIERVLPQADYGWHLNPGHLVADEEWLASPVYPHSEETLQSGMLFQIDIIPAVPGYAGISCESGVLLADSDLQAAIKQAYPDLWARFAARRAFLSQTLGLTLSPDVLPTSIATALCRPFMLDKQSALVVTP